MQFTNRNHLKLNAAKLEVIKVSRIRKNPGRLEVDGVQIVTTPVLPSVWVSGGSMTCLPPLLCMKTLARPGRHSLH